MAKISQLALVAEPDGSETIPMVKDGQTRRGAIGSLVGAVAAPHVAAAQMARDQAADLVLPQNVFVDVPLATAEEAVAQGAAFKIVDSPSGLVKVYQRTAAGSNELYQETTTAALGSDSGGQMVKSKRDHPDAVRLSAEALFRRTLNARELGVLPDAADNTDPMQGSMGYAATNGLRLQIPAGETIVRSLTIPKYLQMSGDTKRVSKIIHKAGETGAMLSMPPGPVIDLRISDLYIWGNDEGAATEHGLYLHARPDGAGINGGLWSSVLDNVNFRKFGGKSIWLRGDASPDVADCPHQFLTLRDVSVFRARSAASRCLSVTGKVGQVYFEGACQFDCLDAETLPYLGTNVCMSREFTNGDAADGGSPVSDLSPYTIRFKATVQNAALAILLDRGDFEIDGSYFENLYGGVHAQFGADATVTNNRFANAAANGGAGFGVKNTSASLRRGGNIFVGGVDKRYVASNPVRDVVVSADSGASGTAGNTTGTMLQIGDNGSGGIDIKGMSLILLNGKATPNTITNIISTHSSGSSFTLRVTGGFVRFSSGGNIAMPSSQLLPAGSTITFVLSDSYWMPVGIVQP